VRATHQIVDRFLRVNQGHPLTVWVGMGGGVEVKKQGHHQFSLRLLGRRGQADLLGEGVLLARATGQLGLTPHAHHADRKEEYDDFLGKGINLQNEGFIDSNRAFIYDGSAIGLEVQK